MAILLTSAFVGGFAAFAIGLFLTLSNGSGDAAPPPSTFTASPTIATSTVTPSPKPRSTSTPQPTATPEPSPSATATPSVLALLLGWSNTPLEWVLTVRETSSYREGDLVPFLLRIDEAEPGTTYDLALTYRCLAADRHAFDFVAGLTPGENAPLLTAPGPGRTTPDSALIVPDDPSIDFDDSAGATFLAWGATFSAASRPEPQTECSDTKTINISVVAQDSTVMLVWTGHLASSEDWGTGNGASSASPFSMEVLIDNEVKQIVTLLPGSVAR